MIKTYAFSPFWMLCISDELMQNAIWFKTTYLDIDAYKMMKKKHMLSPLFEGFAFLTNWCKMAFGLKPHI